MHAVVGRERLFPLEDSDPAQCLQLPAAACKEEMVVVAPLPRGARLLQLCPPTEQLDSVAPALVPALLTCVRVDRLQDTLRQWRDSAEALLCPMAQWGGGVVMREEEGGQVEEQQQEGEDEEDAEEEGMGAALLPVVCGSNGRQLVEVCKQVLGAGLPGEVLRQAVAHCADSSSSSSSSTFGEGVVLCEAAVLRRAMQMSSRRLAGVLGARSARKALWDMDAAELGLVRYHAVTVRELCLEANHLGRCRLGSVHWAPRRVEILLQPKVQELRDELRQEIRQRNQQGYAALETSLTRLSDLCQELFVEEYMERVAADFDEIKGLLSLWVTHVDEDIWSLEDSMEKLRVLGRDLSDKTATFVELRDRSLRFQGEEAVDRIVAQRQSQLEELTQSMMDSVEELTGQWKRCFGRARIKMRSEVVVREMAAPSAFSFGPMSTPSASQAWAVAGVAGTGMGRGEGMGLHLSPPPS